MPGCIDCKYHKSSLDPSYSDKLVFIRKCTNGYDVEYIKWWKENGHKIQGELTNMTCHEHHESTKNLIEINKILDKIKHII